MSTARGNLTRFADTIVEQARGPVLADRRANVTSSPGAQVRAQPLTRREGNATMTYFCLDFDGLDDTGTELA